MKKLFLNVLGVVGSLTMSASVARAQAPPIEDLVEILEKSEKAPARPSTHNSTPAPRPVSRPTTSSAPRPAPSHTMSAPRPVSRPTTNNTARSTGSRTVVNFPRPVTASRPIPAKPPIRPQVQRPVTTVVKPNPPIRPPVQQPTLVIKPNVATNPRPTTAVGTGTVGHQLTSEIKPIIPTNTTRGVAVTASSHGQNPASVTKPPVVAAGITPMRGIRRDAEESNRGWGYQVSGQVGPVSGSYSSASGLSGGLGTASASYNSSSGLTVAGGVGPVKVGGDGAGFDAAIPLLPYGGVKASVSVGSGDTNVCVGPYVGTPAANIAAQACYDFSGGYTNISDSIVNSTADFFAPVLAPLTADPAPLVDPMGQIFQKAK